MHMKWRLSIAITWSSLNAFILKSTRECMSATLKCLHKSWSSSIEATVLKHRLYWNGHVACIRKIWIPKQVFCIESLLIESDLPISQRSIIRLVWKNCWILQTSVHMTASSMQMIMLPDGRWKGCFLEFSDCKRKSEKKSSKSSWCGISRPCRWQAWHCDRLSTVLDC